MKGKIKIKEQEIKVKNTYSDYELIKELSYHIDCTVTEADFDTSHPNPYRIDYAASDIYRYLKYKTGGKI